MPSPEQNPKRNQPSYRQRGNQKYQNRFHGGFRVTPYVGLKVECIDGSKMLGLIRTGDKFTVSMAKYLEGYGCWGLLFADGPSPASGYSCFNGDYFRPIVSRKTDISALQALLVPGAKIRETV